MFLVKWFKGILGSLGLYQKSGDLVFLGLDNAGKTTLLHVLKEDTYTQTDSTIQPHSEELTIGNVRFNTFDLGGHEVARKIWKNYVGAVNGIIFMIDTTDQERMDLAKLELNKLLEIPELNETPICVLGNKVDKKGSLTEEELREELGLLPHQTYGKDGGMNEEARRIEVFMCSVLKRAGYQEGFQWISEFLD
ncbi:unnamed protein product [Moneuplotes crassus]|uniref:Uncharacterized protein n=1 Tax=Euplotes crassus TaxID=5936 RepID=A0AAD1XVJ8_EUPCR|nr:unnamed protein product [Moneuplotes crassus]